MFNIGPMEFLVLGIVAVIVIGPDRLPGLARDAARMLRTLRELATGARTQLRDELGPEFADLGLDDLRNLNPRTALQRAILGDDETGLRADLRKLDPREELRDADPRRAVREMDTDEPISMRKPAERPLARGEEAPFDDDAT
jgi:sec-independent protein translocase protein TatB